jgi:hypothetical protein
MRGKVPRVPKVPKVPGVPGVPGVLGELKKLLIFIFSNFRHSKLQALQTSLPECRVKRPFNMIDFKRISRFDYSYDIKS